MRYNLRSGTQTELPSSTPRRRANSESSIPLITPMPSTRGAENYREYDHTQSFRAARTLRDESDVPPRAGSMLPSPAGADSRSSNEAMSLPGEYPDDDEVPWTTVTRRRTRGSPQRVSRGTVPYSRSYKKQSALLG